MTTKSDLYKRIPRYKLIHPNCYLLQFLSFDSTNVRYLGCITFNLYYYTNVQVVLFQVGIYMKLKASQSIKRKIFMRLYQKEMVKNIFYRV